ncbi:hypothetical protein [Nocardia shimofusensis]|uniref:hypothetical protein n=1 Tax=Nocardia shimofusensis TaxID=228596 RepID=UPI000A02C309|nr:hypothetical protein [Nocardia shimofusensis]
MTEEARRHLDFAATFQSIADATTDWDAPTPVEEWRAHDIVDHLLDWLPPVLSAGADVTLPLAAGDTPAQRWSARARDVQALLEDPDIRSRPVHHGPFAGEPLGHVIDRIYTSDIYMHSWDLARASAIRADLDPAYARTLLESMRPIESVLRSSGHFGPPTHTDSTDPVDQLMAFVGRRI